MPKVNFVEEKMLTLGKKKIVYFQMFIKDKLKKTKEASH
jgi:hypothetical protein